MGSIPTGPANYCEGHTMDLIENLSKYDIEYTDFYNSVHDSIFELFDIELENNVALLNELFNMIPRDLLIDAMKWHISDTEVRDNIYLELKENESTVLDIINKYRV